MPAENPGEARHPEATEDIRSRLRRGLVDAMKARDRPAVAALRSTLAAIDNAEAVDAEAEGEAVERQGVGGAGVGGAGVEAERVEAERVEGGAVEGGPALSTGEGDPPVAGSVLGVGAAEVERRILTRAETAAIVRDEVTEREVAADVMERIGRHDQAEHLRAQAELLTSYLDPQSPPPSEPRAG